MAKQKQPLDSEDKPQQEEVTGSTNEVIVQTVTAGQTQITDTSTTDNYILGILKTFAGYKTLYIDKQGGCYTPDTPSSIRGNAILYTNPYFKK